LAEASYQHGLAGLAHLFQHCQARRLEFGYSYLFHRCPPRSKNLFASSGRWIGTMKITGDIVGPIADESDWDAARE
jgi:hypothetical protein